MTSQISSCGVFSSWCWCLRLYLLQGYIRQRQYPERKAGNDGEEVHGLWEGAGRAGQPAGRKSGQFDSVDKSKALHIAMTTIDILVGSQKPYVSRDGILVFL